MDGRSDFAKENFNLNANNNAHRGGYPGEAENPEPRAYPFGAPAPSRAPQFVPIEQSAQAQPWQH